MSDEFLKPIILPNIGSSDHRTVLMQPTRRSNSNSGRSINVILRSNDKNGRNQLANALTNYNWQPLNDLTPVDSKVSYFNNSIMTLLDTFLPVRVVRRHTTDKPWVTDEFRRLIRRRQFAWTNNHHDQYRLLRNQINRLSKQLRQQFYKKRVRDLRNCDSANWWRGTAKLVGLSARTDLTSLADNCTEGNFQKLADQINESLIKVSSELTPVTVLEPDCTKVPDEYIIHPYEVFNKLSRINIRKSPGPDCIPNWFLRDFAFAISEPICHIFNTSIKEGIMPTVWKMANVIPVPKTKPPKSIESDLRPISLTSTLSKMLESIVGSWILTKIAHKFDIMQYGGIKGRSTTHALINIMNTCHAASDNKRSVRMMFIDYSKAFEYVDHSLLLTKLSHLDIDSFIIRWTASFLSQRQQRVKIGNFTSSWLTLKGGMPQGTWLGIYCFLVHINDLKSNITLYKYIDDVTAIELIEHSDHASSIMQSTVNEIIDWSDKNRMKLNIHKTKEMIVDFSKNKLSPPLIEVENQFIQRVLSFKLLGVTVMNTLSWDNHVTNICLKVNRRLHFLKLLKRSSLSTEDLLHYYKSVIRSVIEYACPVWQSSLTDDQLTRLENLQRRAVKIITGSTDYEFICTVKSIELISVRLNNLAHKFFIKICRPNDCLHSILPAERDINSTQRLRNVKKYPAISARTERYLKSFVPYAIANYQ